MREISDLLPLILPHAASCPDPAAYAAVVTAAREFCRRTRLWRMEDSFTTTGGPTEPFTIPSQAELLEFEHVFFEGRRLGPVSWPDMMRRDRGHSEIALGIPSTYSQPRPDTLVLNPRGIGTLSYSVLAQPAMGAEALPDFLVTQHGETIAWGALREILLLPNQPFTNPSIAAIWATRFDQAASSAFAAGLQGQQRAPLRVRARFF